MTRCVSYIRFSWDVWGKPHAHIHTHRIFLWRWKLQHTITNTVLSFLQLVSIITDETPIEQMKNRLVKDRPKGGQLTNTTHTRKPKIALLREVFGRGKCMCLGRFWYRVTMLGYAWVHLVTNMHTHTFLFTHSFWGLNSYPERWGQPVILPTSLKFLFLLFFLDYFKYSYHISFMEEVWASSLAPMFVEVKRNSSSKDNILAHILSTYNVYLLKTYKKTNK